MIASVDRVMEAGGLADTWTHPTLMVHGGNDRICMIGGARRFFTRITTHRGAASAAGGGAGVGAGAVASSAATAAATGAPATRLIEYAGSMHEIFNETTLRAAGTGGDSDTVESVSQRCIRDVAAWLVSTSAAATASR